MSEEKTETLPVPARDEQLLSPPLPPLLVIEAVGQWYAQTAETDTSVTSWRLHRENQLHEHSSVGVFPAI